MIEALIGVIAFAVLCWLFAAAMEWLTGDKPTRVRLR